MGRSEKKRKWFWLKQHRRKVSLFLHADSKYETSFSMLINAVSCGFNFSSKCRKQEKKLCCHTENIGNVGYVGVYVVSHYSTQTLKKKELKMCTMRIKYISAEKAGLTKDGAVWA